VSEANVEKELSLLPLIAPGWRARARELLTSDVGRGKFISRLWHEPPFDERYVTVLPHERTWPKSTLEELTRRGAPRSCYVISSNELDMQEVRLADALDTLVNGGQAVILICVPGKLAYYQGEEAVGGGYQWIIERPIPPN
jgi:hypothetical protein